MADRIQQKISPFLWFDGTAWEAANCYVAIFPNSRITIETRYTKESAAVSGQPEGQLMTVGFELDGQAFTAINGGPHYRFSGAISFVVHCASQDEVDHYWERLGEGGDPRSRRCGWLTDRFGVTWQVVPEDALCCCGMPIRRRPRASRRRCMEWRRSTSPHCAAHTRAERGASVQLAAPRSSARFTLPVAVFGSASTNSNRAGALCGSPSAAKRARSS